MSILHPVMYFEKSKEAHPNWCFSELAPLFDFKYSFYGKVNICLRHTSQLLSKSSTKWIIPSKRLIIILPIKMCRTYASWLSVRCSLELLGWVVYYLQQSHQKKNQVSDATCIHCVCVLEVKKITTGPFKLLAFIKCHTLYNEKKYPKL